jgi:RES domain-containing protein
MSTLSVAWLEAALAASTGRFPCLESFFIAVCSTLETTAAAPAARSPAPTPPAALYSSRSLPAALAAS